MSLIKELSPETIDDIINVKTLSSKIHLKTFNHPGMQFAVSWKAGMTRNKSEKLNGKYFIYGKLHQINRCNGSPI